MNEPIVRITLRHMENSIEIERHIQKELARVIEIAGQEPTPIYINFVVNPSKLHAHHEIELLVKTPNYSAIVKKEGPDFFTLVDRVCQEMYQKLCEEKRQLDADHKDKRLIGKNRETGEYSRKQRFPKKK